MGDGLYGHAAGELGVRAPGGAVAGVVLPVAEAWADAAAEHVHGLPEHAAPDHFVQLHKGRAVAVGEADYDLRAAALRHVRYLPRVLQRRGDGLFKVERHAPREHHLAVVQALGRRGGDDGVVHAVQVSGYLPIFQRVAAELPGKAPQALGVHVVRPGDGAAQLHHGPGVRAGYVPGAYHEYLHFQHLLLPFCAFPKARRPLGTPGLLMCVSLYFIIVGMYMLLHETRKVNGRRGDDLNILRLQ